MRSQAVIMDLNDEYAPRCRDDRCEVRSTCPLFLDRNNPRARLTADTLRQNWESHKIPCLARQNYFGEICDDECSITGTDK